MKVVPLPKESVEISQSLDIEKILGQFWNVYEVNLREDIEVFKLRGKIIDRLCLHEADEEGGGALGEEFYAAHFDEQFFEHEKAFVNHVLTRLMTISNQAKQEGLEVGTGIGASVLFDVDQTLDNILREASTESPDMQVRPSTKYLLSFLRKYGCHLGLASTRDGELLRQHVRESSPSGSLGEISKFIDGDIIGVYRQSNLGPDRNRHSHDLSVHPDRDDFDESLRQLIQGESLSYTQIALQRLAMAKRELNNHRRQITVVIDNRAEARGMDELLQGKIHDPESDKDVDGYAFLGLEEYRHRLHMIHVGAEYSIKALAERMKQAASPLTPPRH